MERDAWNKQNGQKRFQGMGFPVKKPNEYACIVLKSLFCTIGWYLFLSVQLSVHNFPTESCIAHNAQTVLQERGSFSAGESYFSSYGGLSHVDCYFSYSGWARDCRECRVRWLRPGVWRRTPAAHATSDKTPGALGGTLSAHHRSSMLS